MRHLAKAEYLRCRNAFAFRVQSFTRQQKNQHGTFYRFADGSWLRASHTSNQMSWGPSLGVAWGTTRLWDDRASSFSRKVA